MHINKTGSKCWIQRIRRKTKVNKCVYVFSTFFFFVFADSIHETKFTLQIRSIKTIDCMPVCRWSVFCCLLYQLLHSKRNFCQTRRNCQLNEETHTQSHSHTCILGATSNTFILWNQYEVSTQKRSTPQCYALQSIDKIERTNEVTKLKCSWNIRDAITSTENMQEEKNKVFTIN